MNLNPPSRILIIQTAFIGDVILSTPMIESLNASFPSSKIDFLLRKGNESLFKGHPILNDVLIWEKNKKYTSLFRVINKVRSKKYDLVVNVQRFFNTGLITYLSGSAQKVGFSQNPFAFSFTKKIEFSTDQGLHEVDRNLNLISHLEGIKKLRQPKLYPGKDDFEKARNLVKSVNYITLSPASVWFTKQIPKEVWAGFLRIIPNDLQAVFLGGKEDGDLIDEIINEAGGVGLNLSGKTSFLESAAIMKGALLNYSNDSAPLHMASAVNAPSCALYGSTLPSFGFGPLSDNNRILEISGLNCRPCGLHGRSSCPEGHFKCGRDHDPASLLKAFREIISFEENKSLE